MDIKLIKPKKNGQSDKYSWQLYNFLKKKVYKDLKYVHVFYNQTQKVYENDETIDKYVPFDKNNINISQVWIGNKQDEKITHEGETGIITWYYGNGLSTIIGCSKEKYTSFANPWMSKDDVIDITEWFWSEYIKVGRCIWDRQHNGWLSNDEHRFIYTRNTRKCRWCGQWQEQTIKKVVNIERVKGWRNVS